MCSYAIYRLPHEDYATFVQQTEGEPAELFSCTELNGRSGFVIAPFEVRQDQPILVIRPDKIESRKVECGRWNENTPATDNSRQGNLIPHSTFHKNTPSILPIIMLNWSVDNFVKSFLPVVLMRRWRRRWNPWNCSIGLVHFIPGCLSHW